MRSGKFLALSAAACLCLFVATPPQTQAQIDVNIGVAPDCPYGYYEAAPYGCAPYGYYGPEWFNGGAFVGAGPWFHGPANFHGSVNNHFHPDHGYHGAMPARGEKPRADFHGSAQHFKGNEVHDGHGHVGRK